MKKWIIGLGFLVFMAVVVGVVALVPSVRAGVVATLGSTFNSTGAMFSGGSESPSVVEVPVGENTGDSAITAHDFGRKGDTLKVHILDTQGSAVVVQSGRDAMLIDGGYTADAVKVKAFLKKQGITKLRYAVAVNYHDATRQGFHEVVKSMPVDFIFIAENITWHKSSAGFTNIFDKEGLIWDVPKPNGIFKLGKATFTLPQSHKGGSSIPVIKNGNTKIVVTTTTMEYDEKGVASLPENADAIIINAVNHFYEVPTQVFDKVIPKLVVLGGINDTRLQNEKKFIDSKGYSHLVTGDCGTVTLGSNGRDVVSSCSK